MSMLWHILRVSLSTSRQWSSGSFWSSASSDSNVHHGSPHCHVQKSPLRNGRFRVSQLGSCRLANALARKAPPTQVTNTAAIGRNCQGRKCQLSVLSSKVLGGLALQFILFGSSSRSTEKRGTPRPVAGSQPGNQKNHEKPVKM